MDNIDKKILNILARDSKTQLKYISKQCELSPSAVHQRIKRLEEIKIIRGSRIILNFKKLGYSTTALVGLFLEQDKYFDSVLTKLSKIPEVLECLITTGNYSLLIKVIAKDNKHLMELIKDEIQTIPNVKSTESMIVLDEVLSRAFTFK
jgi:Lrp/AsnC family transcriptional regulator for asnA, asnC and gidA